MRPKTAFQNKAILAEGHSLPSVSPVYWTIWVLDADTRIPYASRMSFDKFLNPRDASHQCFGIDPTPNMLFFNMSSRIPDMRRKMRELGRLWTQMGGK